MAVKKKMKKNARIQYMSSKKNTSLIMGISIPIFMIFLVTVSIYLPGVARLFVYDVSANEDKEVSFGEAQKPLEQVSPRETPKQIPIQPAQEQTTPKPTEKSEVSLDGWVKYTDPQNRFSFFYPPTFGTPSQGTNNGFGDRVAAVRFSEFSSGIQNGKIILGGEIVLTKGFVLVDIQALGGLYDSIALEAFPDTLRNNILSNLPTLTTTNFCGELAKEHHLDINKPAFASLNQQQKDAIVEMDQARNIDPKVIRCDVAGNTVTFHKEVTVEFGQFKSRQNIYGAIRFLKFPFSSFQIIRAATEAPTQEMLSNITSVVKSFK